MITDTSIRNATRRVAKSGIQETMADGEGRGTGRLLLILKPMPTRVTCDWYVQSWAGGRRQLVKLGSYPAMTLADAREVFARDFSAKIQKGASIKTVGDARPGTVADLFAAYVAHLKESGKPSWKEAEKGFAKIARALGAHRPAREIEPEEVIAVLRPIYDRGARSMADHVRSYVRSAFSFGIRSELDYRHRSPRRFRININPAAGIPGEPKVQGSRWLEEAEWVRLYRWLEHPSATIHPGYTRALRLLMLTGQRVQEIARLHSHQYDRAEKLLDWSSTKNGRPHAVPLPDLAVKLLEECEPDDLSWGWFFPSATDPRRPVAHGSLYSFTWRQRETGVIPHFSNRDLRRTWKTLAGKAGLTKEIRDRLQNHALQDVSSKSYDRHDYLDEKRAAMAQWNAYVVQMIETHDSKPAPSLVDC